MPFLFAFGVLAVSFLGIVYVVGKKIPSLLALQDTGEHSFTKASFEKIKVRLMASKWFKVFVSPEMFLQAFLSRLRILSLRVETKTSDWLTALRQKAQERNEKFATNFWEKLKKKSDRPA